MIMIVQVSDFHIGERLRWRGTFQPPPAGRRPNPWPSNAGHDEGVALGLSLELERIQKWHPQASIVLAVTGDLTRGGSGEQFGLAHRFIHANWLVSPGNPLWLGLGRGGKCALTIPGNHDFWSGLSSFPNPLLGRGVLEPNFWPLPWIHGISDVSAGFELHVVGLDSCSGLANFSPSQVAARGAIAPAQLVAAEGLFDTWRRQANLRNRRTIRAVMVHHPPQSLVNASQQLFERWLVKNQVHAIMTGHTHQSCHAQLATTSTLEMRCGTTLQAGDAKMLPGPEPNHFFVHSLQIGATGLPAVEWRSIEFKHSGISWATNNALVWQQVLAPL